MISLGETDTHSETGPGENVSYIPTHVHGEYDTQYSGVAGITRHYHGEGMLAVV